MKVSIKLASGSDYSVTIPDNSTVNDLKAAALVAAPSDVVLHPQGSAESKSYKLFYSGHKMELQSSLHSYGITPVSNSTVYLTNGSQSDESAVAEDAMTDVAVEVAAAEAKSKIRRKSANKRKCSSRGCTSAPLRIVGDCSLCQGKFCSKHRLLENHNCSGLQSCKDQMHERNALKLQSEQTVASKV